MTLFWENLEGVKIPCERKTKNFANAMWLQRNLYLHNEEETHFTLRLESEIKEFLRMETFRRDTIKNR